MAFGSKKGGVKAPKFGGKSRTSVSPPNKKVLEAYGGGKPPVPSFEARTGGNRETGFIQSTPKKATAAMMGRSPPGLLSGGPPRAEAKRQFKRPKGKKVF